MLDDAQAKRNLKKAQANGFGGNQPNAVAGSPANKKGVDWKEWKRQFMPQYRTLSAVEKHCKDLGIKKDVAAEIAHAVFVANKDKIFQAFSRQLLKGDSRAFQTLANRAYGLPPQELSLNQEKPFKLVIEYVGEQPSAVPETITIEPERPAAGDKKELFRLLNERRRLLAEKRLGPDAPITVEDMYARQTNQSGDLSAGSDQDRLEADQPVAEDAPASDVPD